ncbi:hypothetical protein [Stagnihabitans tardus]|uniref:Uncharacterized protein n=1 Tax=Stagnihabitans tardus TaxID=2699202 RepID=A0AAE5BVW5_9RHOB|nr:hypothetical protein [Stagnihabitans tardus]NBZ88642.1 hypothetical protein [Stagnihabitans tardus]
MARQNRVDPQGQIVAAPERGGLMGNRGILHKGAEVTKTHSHPHWVTCVLDFKGRKRPLMAPGRYTELFFLDEATAYASGHRPCGECRRAAYRAFVAAWTQAHGAMTIGEIDRILHAQRIHRRQKVTWQADIAELPDGTMVLGPSGPVLLWQGPHDWSFAGYSPRPRLEGRVPVLTPQSVVALFALGLKVQVALG